MATMQDEIRVPAGATFSIEADLTNEGMARDLRDDSVRLAFYRNPMADHPVVEFDEHQLHKRAGHDQGRISFGDVTLNGFEQGDSLYYLVEVFPHAEENPEWVPFVEGWLTFGPPMS